MITTKCQPGSACAVVQNDNSHFLIRKSLHELKIFDEKGDLFDNTNKDVPVDLSL